MSEVTKLAEAEAARAEAEPDEDETQEAEEVEGAEGEQEAPAEPAPSHDPTEADMKAFQSEHARHERALVKIMGDDFEMLDVCEQCGGMGYAPPEQVKTHENYKACDVCNGFGQVATGSKNPSFATQDCPRCGGRGFLTRRVAPQRPAEAQAQDNGSDEEFGVESWMGDPSIQAGVS
jgi:DnaJ-class molecular chaperone